MKSAVGSIPLLHRSASRPFIRAATLDDYDQIAALESRHGLITKPRNQWRDLWLDNPAYRVLTDWPIGWVVEDREGKIVGTLGNVPTFIYFGNKRFVAAAGRGWAVDVPYRSMSVMLLAHQLRQSGADMNLITTPGATTTALCTKLGWSRVPVGKWDRSEFWVTNHAKVAQGYLDAKTARWISAPLGRLVSPPLRLKDALCRKKDSFKADYQLGWSTGFDGRFDAFWRESKERNPNLLLAARDSDTLRWHFKHSLQRKRIWILTASIGPRLIGYAILERRDVHSLDLTRLLFVDLQTLSRDPELCGSMIRAVLNRCRREGIDLLENAGCWIRELHSIKPPPYRRALDSWGYLYRISNPELEREIKLANAWYPTQYDGDASL